MKIKVYLDASFLFYLTGKETTDAKVAAAQAYTRKCWELICAEAEVYTSDYVISECEDGDAEYVKRRLAMIAETSVLSGDEVLLSKVVTALQDAHNNAVPKTETMDAYHIAVSSLYGMDFLLTWNCKHLANIHTLPRTKKVLESMGLSCPQIVTPRSYLEDYSDEQRNA